MTFFWTNKIKFAEKGRLVAELGNLEAQSEPFLLMGHTSLPHLKENCNDFFYFILFYYGIRIASPPVLNCAFFAIGSVSKIPRRRKAVPFEISGKYIS